MKTVKVTREYHEYISSDGIQYKSYMDCLKHECNKIFNTDDYYFIKYNSSLYVCKYDGFFSFICVEDAGKNLNKLKTFHMTYSDTFEIHPAILGDKILTNFNIEN